MSAAKANRNYSEPEYAKSHGRINVPFYLTSIAHRLVPETQELLEKYSRIPRDQQVEHIHQIRDQAWDIRAYPCTGMGNFLTPLLCRMPIYEEVLRRVGEGAILMDVGTFIGHDLRRLAYDGAPTDRLYGVDIVSHWDVGFDFFRDREHFKGHFIEADLLSTTSPELAALKGQVDIIVASKVLHLWDLDGQTKAAQALVTYTQPGSLIAGNQMGNPKAQEVNLKPLSTPIWRHNPDSFAKMFKAVGAATGTRWETQACLRALTDMDWGAGDLTWAEPDVSVLEFVARRVS